MRKCTLAALAALLLFSCAKQKLAPVAPTVPAGHIIADAKPPFGTLIFSGYTWTIKHTGNAKSGPGPNRWKNANAYVDANGYLHLKITKVGNKWYCAQVTSTQTFGYGTYQWEVEGRVDTLDKNITLGLFNYSGIDGYDEMDIEITRYANTANKNTNYTIYPARTVTTTKFWHTSISTAYKGIYTTQRFTRDSDRSVFFQELKGFTDDNTGEIHSATCKNPPHSISTLAMPVYMNLFLFQGKTPSNNSPAEFVIHSFKFTPQ